MRLALPYFGGVVRHVFDEWFSTRGARIVREVAIGPLWYESAHGVIVEFTYYVEDAPRYAPTINVGVMREGIFRGVGLWAFIPEGVAEADYYRWTFSDPAQLRNVFQRIRDEIMPVYVEALLSNPSAVLAAAERQRVLATLEGELREYPARAPAPDLYAHLLRIAQRLAITDRPELISALQTWVEARSQPRTMIAVDLVEKMALVDLRTDLEQLRADVIEGRAFLPYYVRWIDEALAKLSVR